LLLHDGWLLAQALKRIARRPSDLFVLLALTGLAAAAYRETLSAASSAAAPPRVVMASFAIACAASLAGQSAARARLRWFAEETALSAHAQCGRGRTLYLGGAFVATSLAVVLPAVLLVALWTGAAAEAAALSAAGAAAGFLAARLPAPRLPVRSAREGTGARVAVSDGGSLPHLTAVHQAGVGALQPPSRRAALAGAASAGGLAGLVTAGLLYRPDLYPLLAVACVAALAALMLLTRVDRDIRAVAGALGFTSGELMRAWLPAPLLFLLGFLLPLLALRPAYGLALCAVALALALVQLLQGLLRLLRAPQGSFLVVQIEIGLVAAVTYALPPAGLALAAWLVAGAALRHDRRLWMLG
jgi:hypothetical protein